MASAMVFVDVLPGTPAQHLSGLGAAAVVRNPDEDRPPGPAIWRGEAAPWARAGDGVLIEISKLESAEVWRERGMAVWVICRHPVEVQRALEAGHGLWLRGCEAGGACGQTTALVLMRAVFADGRPSVPWVAEGLLGPARAATLALGAQATLLGPTVWGCAGSPLHPDRRTALARADLRTAWIGPGTRQAYRIVGTSKVDLERIDGDPAAVGATLDQWWAAPSGAAPAVSSLSELAEDSPSFADAVAAERQAVATHLAAIPDHHPLRPGCDPLGTGHPIVQGPMANVAEGPGLAKAVLAAGGLPFLALSALDPGQAEAVLDTADAIDGPVGVGLIAFDLAPFRQAHLDALTARGPRPVIIAGGSVPLAVSLTNEGFHAWMHTPSPRLAGLALSAGVQTVVLEGHEAGGHVGPLPSSALWSGGLAAAAEAVARGRSTDPLVVLAGGIGDAISAAFCAALAAPACAQGVRVALQVGTAFFNASDMGDQLTAACKAVADQTVDTVLVGSTVGLPLRCAPNAFTAAARAQERQWLSAGLSLEERRRRVETQNVGRTRIAAKGIERNPDWSGQAEDDRYRPVPPERQHQEAAFTLGQGAMVTRGTYTVAQLVQRLTEGARRCLHPATPWGEVQLVPGEPRTVPRPIEVVRPLGRRGARPAASTAADLGPIAIVGLGCVLPGGGDVPSYWRSQIRGADSVGPVPPSRWDLGRYHDADAGNRGPGLSMSAAAALAAPVAFDPLRYRIPPKVLASVDPSQRLALLCGDEASAEAGWQGAAFPRHRAGVILGNAMGGEWRSRIALRVRFREVVDALIADGHLDPALRDAIEPELEARLDRDVLPLRPDSMVGLLGNLVAARLASWLDFSGATHTVDAACAASLVAVAQSVDLLRSGRLDAVLTGGVDTDLSPDTYVGFSRTLALSSAGSRPFSAAADGFVMGEGGAAFALKRLEDALADGDPVWAVIRGVGVASDGRGRGLTAPLPDGQIAALHRAWQDAGLDPKTAAYIEAHGTGTELGDRTEASVISDVFAGPDRSTWVGTAKGAVGHLKSAAGAAGLLRATLAVATGIVPPTLHAGDPIAEARDIALPRRPTSPPGGITRAGVSAFGFGGTNAHVVLEAPPPQARRPDLVDRLRHEAAPFVVAPARARWSATHPATGQGLRPSPTLLCFAADDPESLATAIERREVCDPHHAAGSHRAALLTSGEDRVLRAQVAEHLRTGAGLGGLGRRVWLGQGPARPLAFLVPGQGTSQRGATASLERFPAAHPALNALSTLFSSEAFDAEDTRGQHRDLFTLACGWSAVLTAAQVRPQHCLGHSLGEWGALVAAGEADPVELAPLVRRRGDALHRAPSGAMLAVIGEPRVAEALAAEYGLEISAYNSPKTTILSGTSQAVSRAHNGGSGVRTTPLSVAHPFHTPRMAPALAAVEPHLHTLPQGTSETWISAVTGALASPRDTLGRAIVEPVRFAQALAGLPSTTLALELGAGATLTNHAKAAGLDAIALDPRPGSDPHGIHGAAAALWAAGHPGLVGQLPDVVVVTPILRRSVGPAAEITQRPAIAPAPPTPRATLPAPPPHGELPEDSRQAVLAALHEVTGYAPDVLLAAQDLQEDLAVDSIQKLEVMGLLQQRFDLDGSQELGDTGPLNVQGLAALIDAQRNAPKTQNAALTFTHRYRAEWQALSLRPGPHPEPGWDTLSGCRRWCLGVDTDPITATMMALNAAKDQLDATGPWIAWCPDTPAGYAAAAALRTAATERGTATQTVLYTPDSTGLSERPDAAVARLDAQGAWGRRWAPQLHTSGPAPTTVLATGGVKGIVLPCLLALGPEQAWLVGRTPASAPEVVDAMDRLRVAGVDAHYICGDLGLGDTLDRLAAQLSPEVILHGAGILRDRAHAALSIADLEAVFAIKVDALAALKARFPDSRSIVFSSLAAHIGNPGQLAYAAANAAAEGMADTALAFTAWAEVGMAASPAVQAALSLAGVSPLSIDEGTEAFVRSAGLGGTTLITTTPPPDSRTLPWPIIHLDSRDDEVWATLTLDPADPRLAHHQVAGRVVVPAATWVDTSLSLLADLGHDLVLHELRVEAPCMVTEVRHDVVLCLDLNARTVEIRSGTSCLASARLIARARAPSPEAPPTPDRPAHSLYRPDLLFHGPTWQVLDRLGTDGNGTLSADLRDATPATAIDGAHQLIAAWAAKDLGWTGLPVGAARWSTFAGTAPVRLAATCSATQDHVLAEVVGWDASGAVVLIGERVRLARATDVAAEATAVLRGSP